MKIVTLHVECLMAKFNLNFSVEGLQDDDEFHIKYFMFNVHILIRFFLVSMNKTNSVRTKSSKFQFYVRGNQSKMKTK